MFIAPDVTSKALADLVSLRGRTALVTGGASGIGEACARRLGEAGAHVVIADVNGPGCVAAVDRLRQAGADVSSIVLDVTDSGAVDRAISSIGVDHGPVEVTVNAAGIFPP